jgi:hypothetical protein
MRVCLISVEIFAWKKYGGFGRATFACKQAIDQHLAAYQRLLSLRAAHAPVHPHADAGTPALDPDLDGVDPAS